jgi:arylsulfatase A-like enzyme
MKLLVIAVRGLRAGALGAYGNPWLETASLDALAAQSVVFDGHFADRADSAGARRAWCRGRYDLPRLDPVSASGAETVDPAPAGDLLGVLRQRGIFTQLIVDPSAPPELEFAQGWDEVERVQAAEEPALEATLEAARSALDQLAERDDWLLWIDLATPLPPWNIPDEFRELYFSQPPGEESSEPAKEMEEVEEVEEEEADFEEEVLEPFVELPAGPIDPDDDELFLSLHASYAAAVSYLDAGMGALLEALGETTGSEEVAVLLTADRGLPLGEHGTAGFEPAWPHEELMHLPLILWLPGGEGAGRHIAALTQAVDLAPTIAGWFGVGLPGAQGHDLLPLARRQVERVRDYACGGVAGESQAGWVLRTPEWAFLLLRKTPEEGTEVSRLYVKPDDCWEVNDVVQQHPELAEQMERALRAFVQASSRAGRLEVPPLELTESPAKPLSEH